jgi:hypothetical protein
VDGIVVESSEKPSDGGNEDVSYLFVYCIQRIDDNLTNIIAAVKASEESSL